MKLRVTNTKIGPIYWAHLHPWPLNKAMEVDVPESLAADIQADTRLVVDVLAGVVHPIAVAPAFDPDITADDVQFDPGEETPAARRGPGRPKKAK